MNWLGTARGRLGYAMNDTMAYVTGGLAVGGAQAKADIPGPTVVGSGTQVGWTAGAGIEHAFSNRLSGKIEYLYTDLGTLNIAGSCSTNCFTKVQFSEVRVGLNFKF